MNLDGCVYVGVRVGGWWQGRVQCDVEVEIGRETSEGFGVAEMEEGDVYGEGTFHHTWTWEKHATCHVYTQSYTRHVPHRLHHNMTVQHVCTILIDGGEWYVETPEPPMLCLDTST